jgi:hypothetical protein
MKIYSYMIDHDYGLAPNPFGSYCTLTVCKPKIRKSRNLKKDDWLIGTGSKSLEKSSGVECVSKLIYAMQVSEIIDLNSYWNDIRFEYKKPIVSGGTLSTMFGDNFYYLDENKKWVQIDCAHKNIDGIYNKEHFRKDTCGKNSIISERFYYFGDNAPKIPDHLIEVCHITQGEKIVRPEELAIKFLKWLESNFQIGISGLPISWARYNKQ